MAKTRRSKKIPSYPFPGVWYQLGDAYVPDRGERMLTQWAQEQRPVICTYSSSDGWICDNDALRKDKASEPEWWLLIPIGEWREGDMPPSGSATRLLLGLWSGEGAPSLCSSRVVDGVREWVIYGQEERRTVETPEFWMAVPGR